MGESEKSLGGFKGYVCKKLGWLENYTKFVNRDEPLPPWSSSDVDNFISIDPVNGPILRTAREAVKYGVVGSAVGAVFTAQFAWKYSRSPHGAVLALGLGAVAGWAAGHEVANHTKQLYRLDTMSAQTKFLEWWETKSAKRY